MALGEFGSLITSTKNTYDFSLSGDYAMNTLLKTIGKTNFATPVINTNQPQQNALENMAEEGHVEVLS